MKWLLPVVTLVVGLVSGWFLAGPEEGESQTYRSKDTGAKSFSSAKGANALSKEGNAPELTKAEAAALESIGASGEWLAELEDMNQLDQMSSILERIKLAKPADFKVLMGAIQKHSGSMRWMAQNVLAMKWASTAPHEMVSYIESQPEQEQWSLRNSFYGAWAREDPDAAYASAKGLDRRRSQQSAMQSVIQAIAVEEPQYAIELLEEMAEMGHRADWMMQNIYRSWANQNLVEARTSALSMEDGPYKSQALSGALSSWMHEDPYAALDWLDSLEVNGAVYNSKKEVFRNLLNRDFDTAKEYIAGKTDPLARREILRHVSLGNLAWNKDYSEIEGMYSWLGEVATGQVYDQKVGDLIRSLVGADRERGKAFVMEMPAGNARVNAIASLAQQITQEDPLAGLEFAIGLEYEDEKQRALSQIGWQLSRYGADAIKPIIAGSEDPIVQQQLASRLVGEWSKYDQVGALEWSESLTDDSARNRALQSVYQNWLQADPQAALTYLESSIEEDKRANYFGSGIQEWARQDPAVASEWLDKIPASADERKRADIYGNVARAYVQHDPMAASEWISTLEDGPNRDKSVETLVQNISKTDPEAGFIWSATLSDENKRKNSLKQSVRSWVKIDPDGAYDAVKDSRINAEEKTDLFEMIERARK